MQKALREKPDQTNCMDKILQNPLTLLTSLTCTVTFSAMYLNDQENYQLLGYATLSCTIFTLSILEFFKIDPIHFKKD
ncbi:MAG: hypothetical protein H6850_01145 [Alphaproteobacteria bacterium]|nr:MAG: hypothetical protein H6850_01145 [Alphaproteobacteria bacterium]